MKKYNEIIYEGEDESKKLTVRAIGSGGCYYVTARYWSDRERDVAYKLNKKTAIALARQILIDWE